MPDVHTQATPAGTPPPLHPLDPRRGENLSPMFAGFLCWLLDLEARHGAQPVGPGGENPWRRAENVQQARGERAGVIAETAAGQQQFDQLAVVDGLAPGAQEAGLEPAAAGGLPDRGRRRRHVEVRHVAEARFGRVERSHAAVSRWRAHSRSAARARHCSISRPYSSENAGAIIPH